MILKKRGFSENISKCTGENQNFKEYNEALNMYSAVNKIQGNNQPTEGKSKPDYRDDGY